MNTLARTKVERDAWIASARAQFQPTPRQACRVCGQFASIAQAHHIRPLAMQSHHRAEPDHSHVWLCPNHHVAVHIMLGQAIASSAIASRACINVVVDLSDPPGHLERVNEIVEGAFA